MSSAQITLDQEKATITLQNDLVATTAAELRPLFRDLVKDGATTVHIDMTAVKKIDSHGISLLVAISNSLLPKHGDLILTGVIPPIFSLFQTLQLTKRFKVNPE